MSFVPGPSFTDSPIAAIDAVHFDGLLCRSIAANERAEFVELNVTGPAQLRNLFLRSRYSSWLEHPSFGQMIAGLGEKGAAISAALAKSKSYSFIASGSDRLFSTLGHPSGGRNIPVFSTSASGVVDFDPLSLKPAGQQQTWSPLSVQNYTDWKFLDVSEYCSLAILMRSLPDLSLLRGDVWSQMSEADQRAATSEGQRPETDEEEYHRVFHETYVTTAATLTDAYAITSHPLVLVAGTTVVRMPSVSTSAPMILPRKDRMILEMMRHTGEFHQGTPTTRFTHLDSLRAIIDAISDDLRRKGFAPTGKVRITELVPPAGAGYTSEYVMPSGSRITALSLKQFPNNVANRNGTSSFVYGLWNMGFVFELVGEHPRDVFFQGWAIRSGAERVAQENYLWSSISFFRGGISTADQADQATLAWHLSSLDEKWHVGSADPLATLDVGSVLLTSERSAFVESVSGFALTRASLESIRHLGAPRWYLPIIAPIGGADVLLRIGAVQVGSYKSLALREQELDTAIEIGSVDIDDVAPSDRDEGQIYDPTIADIAASFDATDDAQVLLVAGMSAVMSVTLDVVASRYCASGPATWLVDCATTGFGFYKPMSTKDVNAITSFCSQLEDKSIAFAAYKDPIRFPTNIVEQTELYRVYKKAREKACKVNDFLKQSYNASTTWGEAQTNVTALGSTRALYGIYDPPAVVVVLAAQQAINTSYAYNPGTAPATLKKTVNGVLDEVSSTEDDAESVFENIALGATLTGITIVGLGSSWSDGSTGVYAAEAVAEMQKENQRVRLLSDPGKAGAGGASLNWGSDSFTVNGFPLIEKLLYQDGLKAIINSVNTFSKPGSVFRHALERNGANLYASSIVAGKRKIVSSASPNALFDAKPLEYFEGLFPEYSVAPAAD